MTTPVSAATAMPTTSFGTPKAPSIASAIELACTALKTRPKERIRQTEKIAAAHGASEAAGDVEGRAAAILPVRRP